MPHPCVHQYLSKYVDIGWRCCPWQGPVEGVGGYVGILPVNSSFVIGKKMHQFLVLRGKFMQIFCCSCCNWWCRIFRWGAVYHICLVLKLCGKAAYDVFNKCFFSVASFLKGKLSRLCEFLMGFAKNCFEHNVHLLDGRKTIPGLDRLSEISCLLKNGIGLGDCLMV